ncbi:MAG: cysteine--tRNA ligase [Candidatus Andersenbacteria bacterium]
MPVTLYNTLTKRVEPFAPADGKTVRMYSCGPTVYAYPHIGNLRRYIVDDVLVRVLRRHWGVDRVVNITDVGHLTDDEFDRGEDKLIVAARKEGKGPLEVAAHYTDAFKRDLRALGIIEPETYAHATDHIADMQALTAELIEHGNAYVVDGNVYYDVGSFKDYGKLSGNTLAALREHVRPEVKDAEVLGKRSPHDFALWIAAPADHLLKWPSAWGEGYPGWHIECAAMIRTHLGESIDLHTGGEDNIFPHHEGEIAEVEPLTGKPLAHEWLHTRHLLVDGKKMAKRDGNVFRLADVVARGYSPLAFRYLVLQSHYSSHLNFTWEALAAAAEGWRALQSTYGKLLRPRAGLASGKVSSELATKLKQLDEKFFAALDGNLDTPGALSVLSELAGEVNRQLSNEKATSGDLTALRETLDSFDEVLGVLLPEAERVHGKALTGLTTKLKQYLAAKAAKDFAKVDALRAQLKTAGFSVQDQKDGGVAWTSEKTGDAGFYAQ